ncbi:MAG TPA: hypothetical protein VER79_13170, partial [Candidatus Limnocylindrales bacterium]|nr:hypothetical protein [Candidatus Limnocylindrales bacterium]
MTSHLYDGTGSPPPETQALRAGPLTLDYENGLIRNVRLGEREIVRAVYAAVRDHNWGTVPGVLKDVALEVQPNSFDLRFTSEHQQDGVHFVWHGQISGSATGVVQFSFDGEARSSFQRNRIGFCVLHPMELGGQPMEVVHTDGTTEASRFPRFIAPHQPVYDIRALRHQVLPGLTAEVRMDGDAFEMEDQRNWTDASFKTYCTPLGLPFPVDVQSGERVQQEITIRLIGTAPAAAVDEPALIVSVSDGSATPVPPIGIGWAAGAVLSERERTQLAALKLAHLRVEVVPETALDILHEAADTAHALGAQLEVALHLGDDLDAGLHRVAAAADAVRPPVIRWLVFREGEPSTTRETVLAARAALERFG